MELFSPIKIFFLENGVLRLVNSDKYRLGTTEGYVMSPAAPSDMQDA